MNLTGYEMPIIYGIITGIIGAVIASAIDAMNRKGMIT